MNSYRQSWITDRDFKIIKSFRFNCVRLPLNYRQFEDDSRPFHLRPDAWEWTDRALRMAEGNGLYVILDMHGAQGGQSPYDHTGRSDQNKLWSVPENGKRLAWLWGEIAKRYRRAGVVVAYDVFNEPYGGQMPEIRREFERCYAAIRKEDPDKLIWAHGRYDGFDFYGSPSANGWKNVGIQMHYYPGLFGNGAPTVRTQAQHLDYLQREVAPKVRALNVPFLVGEMNVVFSKAGGAEMMRRTFDLHERFGWNTTMWTYKALSQRGGVHDDSWGMVTNRDPIPQINFLTSTKSEIESFFTSHATMAYAINSELEHAMAPPSFPMGPLPVFPSRLTAPQQALPGWDLADIGGGRTGGLQIRNGGFDLFGGGSDIWGVRDQFRFLYQRVEGDFQLVVRVDDLEDLGSYCKAGLMARESLDASAAHVLISSFPSGELQMARRPATGADTIGSASKAVGLPVWIRLSRTGSLFTADYRKEPSVEWSELGHIDLKSSPSRLLVGLVSLSQYEGHLVKASLYGSAGVPPPCTRTLGNSSTFGPIAMLPGPADSG